TKFSFKRIESLRYRKVYAIDPCLIFSLAEDFSMNRGFLLENIVFLELHRRKMFNSTELFYYKQPTFEVDFLVRRNRTVVELIQVCTSLDNPKTLNREVKALVTGYQETGAKQLTIITEDDAREIVFDGVKIRCLQVIDWLLNPDYSK
ncbi:MAG: DUF4143 domain-containing protein, partial [Bacteroidetes bacterium]|nr:DUF4143 domain-containing protein [Bacteroidota bacterium]